MTEVSAINSFAAATRPALRQELKKVIALAGKRGTPVLEEMITYQLGWTGDNAGPKAEGKGLRALFCTLACQAAGGDWQDALPAAAAVELIHNFSLIHDDIEDNSDKRRGRPTVWKLWGEAQAINTGDAMFALANISLLNLAESASPQAALEVGKRFHATCLHLTQGQHLDIAFEDQDQIELDTYWQMVEGKTAALLAFSLEAGAICAGADPDVQAHYRDFGHYLGMAFQVQDDILGIWGKEELTGKSTTGDLITRKKTLPVLYGLTRDGEFKKAWTAGEIHPKNAPRLAEILEAEGGLAYAQKNADRLTSLALEALEQAKPEENAGNILFELAKNLLTRRT